MKNTRIGNFALFICLLFILSASVTAQEVVCPSAIQTQPCPSPEMENRNIKDTEFFWFDIHSFYFIVGNSENPKTRAFAIRAFNKKRDMSVYIYFDDSQQNKPPHVSADKKTFRLFYPASFLQGVVKMLESKERMYFGYRKYENGHIWASIEGYGVLGATGKSPGKK